MKASKEDLENAVLFFAKEYDQEQNYIALMNAYRGTPKIVEMITYEMFIQRFNSYHCTDEQYHHYKILHDFATELKEFGYVKYDEGIKDLNPYSPTAKWITP
jgi:hypothetical protein